MADSCLGKMLDKEKNRGQYQLYLSNKDVRWGSFDLEHLDMMKFEESEEERYGIRVGDLIICEGGEPGRCAIWRNQIPHCENGGVAARFFVAGPGFLITSANPLLRSYPHL